MNVDVEGGVGTASVEITEMPTWATGAKAPAIHQADGERTLTAYAPPVAGLSGSYELTATDQASPTPATVKATLIAVASLPAGSVLCRKPHDADFFVNGTVWPQLFETTHRFSGDTEDRPNRVTYDLRRHAADGRLLVRLERVFFYGDEVTSYHNSAIVGKEGHEKAVCDAFGAGGPRPCTTAEMRELWTEIRDHIPPYGVL